MRTRTIQHNTYDPLAQQHRKSAMTMVWILAIFVSVFLILFLPGAEYPLLVLLTLPPVTIALWFGPIGLLSPYRDQRWYDPATLFNTAVFYFALKGVTLAAGERPIYLHFLSFETISTNYILVSLYVTAGLLAWNWTYRRILNREVTSESSESPEDIESESSRAILNPALGVILLSLIGFASFFMFFRSIGTDIFIFIASPLQRSYLTDATLGIASPLANVWRLGIGMIPAAAMFWLAAIGSQNKKPNIFWWLYALMSVGIALLTGGRSDTIGFMLTIIIIYHLLVSPLRLVVMVPFGAAAVLYSYVINTWRSVIGSVAAGSVEVGQSALASTLSVRGLSTFLGSTDLTDIRLFVLILDSYGGLLPLKYGVTFLRIFSQFVPRVIWPNKPLDLGLEIANLYRPGSLTGTPPGFFAEMYMNFHALGVVVGSLLLGAGLALLYRKWIVLGGGPLAVTLYAILAPRILLLSSATFSNSIANLLPLFFGVTLAFIVSNVSQKSRNVVQRRSAPRFNSRS